MTRELFRRIGLEKTHSDVFCDIYKTTSPRFPYRVVYFKDTQLFVIYESMEQLFAGNILYKIRSEDELVTQIIEIREDIAAGDDKWKSRK